MILLNVMKSILRKRSYGRCFKMNYKNKYANKSCDYLKKLRTIIWLQIIFNKIIKGRFIFDDKGAWKKIASQDNWI